MGILTYAEATAASLEQPEDFEFSFNNDMEAWETGFADYPKGEEKSYELESGYSPLPKPLNPKDGSVRISGHNHSDYLFMFMKKKISGLEPSTEYNVFFRVEIASNVPGGMMGVGGSPGSSVHLKAGATKREPKTIVDDMGYYRMDIDKGNQASTGKDMINIGNMENGSQAPVYRLVDKVYPDAFVVKTDKNGDLWIMVGTDSGFEAVTTVYYNSVKLTVAKK